MTQSNPSSGPAPFVPRELTTAEVQLRNQAQADLAIKRLHIAQQCEFERQLQSCTQPNLIPFEVAAHHFAYLPTPPLLQSFLKQSKAALEHRIPQLPPHSILPVPSQPAEGQTKPHTLTDQAMQAAEGILVSKIRPRAQKRARTVLRGIYEATYALIKARGQLSSANTYTFFTVLDVLPAAVNLSAATCERATADLREAGLIATWTSWTTAGFLSHQTGEVIQQRIKQGVWLTVSLKPREGHKAVTLTQELPKESPRDLAADRRAGNTAWQIRQEVRESISPEEGNISIYSLLKWSLPKNTHQNTVKLSDSLTSLFSPQERPEDLIWNLSALMTVPPTQHGEVIEAAGVALAKLFRDEHSERHYFRLLWRVVQTQYSGQAVLGQLQHLMVQVLADLQELNIKRPGAWLRSRLKAFGWLDHSE